MRNAETNTKDQSMPCFGSKLLPSIARIHLPTVCLLQQLLCSNEHGSMPKPCTQITSNEQGKSLAHVMKGHSMALKLFSVLGWTDLLLHSSVGVHQGLQLPASPMHKPRQGLTKPSSVCTRFETKMSALEFLSFRKLACRTPSNQARTSEGNEITRNSSNVGGERGEERGRKERHHLLQSFPGDS